MLGFTAPCSTLTTIRRLTPAASASTSSVQPRAVRSSRTRAPITVASESVSKPIGAS